MSEQMGQCVNEDLSKLPGDWLQE